MRLKYFFRIVAREEQECIRQGGNVPGASVEGFGMFHEAQGPCD